MRDLLLTLGHNASAALVQDGRVLNAYELERITGVKSDSRFPAQAIEQIELRLGFKPGDRCYDRVYVCHWAPGNAVDDMKNKYWDRSFFSKDVPIISHEQLNMTHHDAHAFAAVAFAGSEFPSNDAGVLVIDGFGNFGEHISYYRFLNGHPQLVRRVFGYETSLGLMYQYATSFLGMKMHEDEYKLLGYGAKVLDVGLDLDQLNETSLKLASAMRKQMRSIPTGGTALDALPTVQEMWHKRFSSMLEEIGMTGQATDSFEARAALGYMVQRVLETVVINFLGQEVGWPRNLICTGGVFYNVALNRLLLNAIQGKLCVMPLAGDQGNAFGVWAAHNSRTDLDFGDLCWGVRDFGVYEHGDLPDGMHMFLSDGPDVAQLISDQLGSTGFVNIVRGKMEFGPRALCNTTTLAVADDAKVVDEINRINGRNTVMPFAPVIWHEHLIKAFPSAEKLHKSEKYMICACDYNPHIGEAFVGAALKTAVGKLTGRPQSYAPKYDGDSVAQVLKQRGVLINTSFNVHGVPIVCDLSQVIHSHQFQRERNPNVVTIVIKDQQ